MGHKVSKKDGPGKAQYSASSPSKTAGSSVIKSGASNVARQYDLSKLAVITVVFNPIKYKSRYDHYQKFEAHMIQCGVHLITVECIFESAPHFGLSRQNFEITRANDRRHIRLVAPSIIWLKENLINIAIQSLPQNIEYVAWLDADIEFERPDWPHLTIAELQRYPIVQLFELSFFLGPGGKKDILRRDYSFGYSIRHNKPINPTRFQDWYAHPGYAWAMRRSAFNTMGGLLDFCIIGSGDLHFAFALLHRIEETIRPGLHPDYRKLAIAWGDRLAQLAQNGANVGYVPVNLWHHWHGERKDRNYVDRWAILEKHQYSPLNDLEKNDNTGLLRLADKRTFGRPDLVAQIEALEADIVAYFKSRKEDNNVKTDQVQRPPPVKTKPFVAAKTQPHRGGGGGGGFKPTKFPSSGTTGSSRPQIWSSGPSGTHVDDHSSDSSDDEHHHHHHHHDDEHHQHHHGDEHHQHHHGDEHHQHHHGNEHHHHQHGDEHHHHHGDWSNADNSGHNYNHSSGGGYDYNSGGGFDNTNYGGPGSFY